MSGLGGFISTAEIALSAATAKTVIQLTAPSNRRVKIAGWGVFFDGISPSAEPVQVSLVIQTTAGTMTSLTPIKLTRGADETIQSTAQHTATAEPTATDEIDMAEVHPQGAYEIYYPQGPTERWIGGGERVGIKCTAPAAVNVRAKITFEE